jgi:hypothetical protein
VDQILSLCGTALVTKAFALNAAPGPGPFAPGDLHVLSLPEPMLLQRQIRVPKLAALSAAIAANTAPSEARRTL